MKVFILLVFGILFMRCTNSPDCNNFKTGKFNFQSPNGDIKTTIVRNDSIQIEKKLTNNQESKYRVTWVNQCTYILEILSGSDEIMKNYQGKKLQIEITSTGKDYYFLKATFDGLEYFPEQKVLKIE